MVSAPEVQEANDSDLSYVQRALKRRKAMQGNPQYIDLRFLVPTSNKCERTFSKAGCALSDRRTSLCLVRFE